MFGAFRVSGENRGCMALHRDDPYGIFRFPFQLVKRTGTQPEVQTAARPHVLPGGFGAGDPGSGGGALWSVGDRGAWVCLGVLGEVGQRAPNRGLSLS